MTTTRARLNFVLTTFAALGLAAGGCDSSNPSGAGGSAGGRGAMAGASGHAGGISGSAGSGAAGAGASAGAGGGSAGGAAGAPAGVGGAIGTAGAGGGAGTAGGAAGTTGGAGAGGAGSKTGAGGAATGGSAGNGAGGAAGSAGAAGGGAGGGATGPTKVGVVALTESTTSFVIPTIGATTITAAGAVASYSISSGDSSACQTTTAGSCQVFTNCPTTSTPSTIVDAGTISITGLNPSPVTLSRISATQGYISTSYMAYLWTASTPTTVTVGGSTSVPAYSMSINAPNPITLTAPVPSSVGQTGATYTIPRGANLAVTWTGGVDGTVTVSLTSGTAPSGVTVTCTAAASAGSVTIPASLMASLGATGGFTAGVTSSATKTVGEWLMDFQASALGSQGTATFN